MWRCWFFHDWSRWSQEAVVYTRCVIGSPVSVDQKTVTNVRRCARCGLEKRKVAWSL